ncbi:alpha/beta-hydrolase [Wallemia mellicola]|uniref:Alpha/beta-hydrolase n=1 Tax=Wallemia mellicola TaxID=1708541 RepID=A0A4T0NVB2_9BASI|nr:alpha/beta-hydrolase [Wallemia mellicola]
MSEISNLSFHVKDPFSWGQHGKHTAFKFVPTLPRNKQVGVLDVEGTDAHKRVGTYIWPRDRCDKEYNDRDDVTLEDGTEPLVGITIHGGAYVHMSAEEKCSTSIIPKRLMESGLFLEIHSVEYRLIHYSAFPGALLDVASVFDNLINERKVPPSRIVIVGDSAGGNLALALARFIKDERHEDTPAGLLLLSPWCDPSFSFPFNPTTQRRRPNEGIDYLMDTPVPRALIIESFIGCTSGTGQGCPTCTQQQSHTFIKRSLFKQRKRTSQQHNLLPDHISVHSPYISPASLHLKDEEDLFEDFPPTFISYGTAERLEDEIKVLIERMERNNVDLTTNVAEDGVHDLLILGFWNERQKDAIWNDIFNWSRDLSLKSIP